MEKLKNIIAAAAIVLAGAAATVPASAVTCPDNSKHPGDTVSTAALCNMEDDDADGDFMTSVNNIINIVLSVMGVLAVIVVIIGGFMYMTSTGDAGKTKTAKDTIMYGIIGLLIALLAFAIVNFVLKTIFGSNS